MIRLCTRSPTKRSGHGFLDAQRRAFGILAPDANGRYSIKALLTVSHTNTIILIAYDKSTNHNKSADTTVINYNSPGDFGAPSDTTIQQLSTIQFTVTAKDPDSDKVSLKRRRCQRARPSTLHRRF